MFLYLHGEGIVNHMFSSFSMYESYFIDKAYTDPESS